MKQILRLVQFVVVVYLILQGLLVLGQAISTLIVFIWLNPTEGFDRNWPRLLLFPVLSPILLFIAFWLSRKWQFHVLHAGSIRSLLLATTVAVVVTTLTQSHTLRLVNFSDTDDPRIELYRDYTFTGRSVKHTTFRSLQSTDSEKTRQYLLRTYWQGDDEAAYIVGTLSVSFLATWMFANYFRQRSQVATPSAQ